MPICQKQTTSLARARGNDNQRKEQKKVDVTNVIVGLWVKL